MKRNFTVCAILAAAMILVPLITMQNTEKNVSANQNMNNNETSEYDGYISVMKTDNGKIEELTEREYLVGALAAEMNVSSHDEALKAQAVACYTYALYIKGNKNEVDNLKGADISDSAEIHQGCLSKEERKKKWGENFEDNEKKAQEIVESVLGEAIYYDNKPIMAVYHDLNNGKTQSAETVWKKAVPYLVQTESPGDKLSVNYSASASFTYDEFESKIEQIDGVTVSGEKEKWVGDINKNSSGYVESIEICSDKISSADFKTVLGLRSCCFTVSCSDEKITVTTVGNGHMVGMSQYGADYMARQGSDYREILRHYYKGTEIR